MGRGVDGGRGALKERAKRKGEGGKGWGWWGWGGVIWKENQDSN